MGIIFPGPVDATCLPYGTLGTGNCQPTPRGGTDPGNSPRYSTNALRHCCQDRGGMSACRICRYCMLFSMWPSMAASGVDCRSDSATGTPSTCGGTGGRRMEFWTAGSSSCSGCKRIWAQIKVMRLDRTHIKAHLDGTCARKNGAQCIDQFRGGGNPPLPLVAAEARTVVASRLSIGHAHDAPEGRLKDGLLK